MAMYDGLIYCSATSSGQPTFHFKIKIPDRGSRNKLFRVTLRDSHTTVSYYVTTYSYRSSLIQNNTVSLYTSDQMTTSEPTEFFIMLSCLGAIGFAFGLLLVFAKYRLIIIARLIPVKDQCVYLKTRQSLVVSVYCVFKLLYSVAFSLTALILLLQLICGDDLERVNDISRYHLEVKQLVERNIQDITKFKRTEMERQNNMKEERINACSGYALKNVQALRLYVNRFSTELRDRKNYIEDKKFNLLMGEVQSYLEATKEHVDKVHQS